MIVYIQYMRNKKQIRGFTLIELLVVIGILAILLAIVLIAINPARQFAQARNTTRESDVKEIVNAVYAYAADNTGNLPAGIDATVKTIASGGAVGTIDLCPLLVPRYIADIAIDPTTGTEAPPNSICTAALATYNSTYTIVRSSATDNRITITAPNAELSKVITLTR